MSNCGFRSDSGSFTAGGSRLCVRRFWLKSLQNFLREQFVSSGAAAVFIVVDDRLAETGRFSQARAAGNHRFEDAVAEMLADFIHDLLRKFGPPIEHGH